MIDWLKKSQQASLPTEVLNKHWSLKTEWNVFAIKNGEVILKEILKELLVSIMTKNRVKELCCTDGCSPHGREIKNSEVLPSTADINSYDGTNKTESKKGMHNHSTMLIRAYLLTWHFYVGLYT